MNSDVSVLQQAVSWFLEQTGEKPTPSRTVEALLAIEKLDRHRKINDSLSVLLGEWQLCFITGTLKTRQKAGKVLGAGRYLPQFIRIQLAYYPSEDTSEVNSGRIENCVAIGGLKLTLLGPVKYLDKKHILVFDFTQIVVEFWGKTIYKNYIRGGKLAEETFAQTPVSQQAFFTYFCRENNVIAARGKGGGLALWGRKTPDSNE